MRISDIIGSRIVESIPLSKYKNTMRTYGLCDNVDRFAELFKHMEKHGWKMSKNGYRLYKKLDIVDRDVSQSDTLKKVETELSKHGYDIVDYIKGIAKDKNNRLIKIGKLLSRINTNLLKNFNEDIIRSTSKSTNILTVITRHPYDYMGRSTDRGWTSCMNLDDETQGMKRFDEYMLGELTAYQITADDLNINHPTARVGIKPLINTTKDKNGFSNVVFSISTEKFGMDAPEFLKSVRDFITVANDYLYVEGQTYYQADQAYKNYEISRYAGTLTVKKLNDVGNIALLSDDTVPVADDAIPFILSRPELAYNFALRDSITVDSVMMKKIVNVLKKSPKFLILLIKKIGPRPDLEKYIATNADASVSYANDTLKGRFILGEPTILASENIDFIMSYMEKALGFKTRWPEAEEIILRHPKQTARYAQMVIKGPWPAAEPVIATDPMASFVYAASCLHGPFPMGEDAIATSARASLDYAKYVLERPWPKGEPAIKSNNAVRLQYEKSFSLT